MGAIYHLDKPYTRDVITDSHLSKTSSNSLKNAAVTELVDNVVAPVEEGTTASQAYSAGDELIFNNVLYKTISAITEGDTITPGTNAALAGTIVSQLKALFDGETVLKRKDIITSGTLASLDDGSRGITYFWYAGNLPDSPAAINGHLININALSGVSMQIAISYDLSGIYIRKMSNNVWDTTWKQIYGFQRTYSTSSSSLTKTCTNNTTTDLIGLDLPAGIYIGTFSLRAAIPSGSRLYPSIYTNIQYTYWDERAASYSQIFTLPSAQTVYAKVYASGEVQLTNAWIMFQAIRIE